MNEDSILGYFKDFPESAAEGFAVNGVGVRTQCNLTCLTCPLCTHASAVSRRPQPFEAYDLCTPFPLIPNPPNSPILNPPNIVPLCNEGEVLLLGGGGV